MKKLITAAISVIVLISAAAPGVATYLEETDYMRIMLTAATEGDWSAGQEAQFARAAKIDQDGLMQDKVNFEDLYLLSKIIYAEAGSYWLSDDWKMCVGEVVLNRVASSEFPNTIAEVIFQPGQYYGAGSSYFAKLNPDLRCAELALRLLQGERVMDKPSVVFQANFRQGSGVHRAFYDEALGWTYFCESSRIYLYKV